MGHSSGLCEWAQWSPRGPSQRLAEGSEPENQCNDGSRELSDAARSRGMPATSQSWETSSSTFTRNQSLPAL